jgi:hypothetical protein
VLVHFPAFSRRAFRTGRVTESSDTRRDAARDPAQVLNGR